MIVSSASQTLITGVYRTGTEFVAQLVSGHPHLSSTMYHVNAPRFVADRYDPLAENLDRALAETAERLRERYDLCVDTAAVAGEIHRRGATWATFYDVLVSALWLAGDKVHWAEKCQLVWRQIPEFVATMPNGRAIMVIRDPRSVLASFKSYTYAQPPAYLGAVFNCLDAMAHAERFARDLGPQRFLAIRYEDAAAAPQQTADGIYRFLGLDPALAVFDRSTWRNDKGEPWLANSSFQNTADFDVQASINRWRDKLEDWEIAFAEHVCGDRMGGFGYQPSGAVMDWHRSLAAILPDPVMAGHLHRFVATGQGIQAFPSDPLDKSNWEENAKKATE